MAPYNTTAQADTYFAARYGYDLWAAITEEADKTKLLTSAQQHLDVLCEWYGYKTDSEQANEFPRNGDAEVDADIQTAELEIAYNILSAGSVATDPGAPLTKLKAGSAELEFNATAKDGNPLVNGLTKKLLSPYGICDFGMGSGNTHSIPIFRG